MSARRPSAALQPEGAPDAQHGALRDSESRAEATAAPARCIRRLMVQRLREHGRHQGIADRARRPGARPIRQTLHAVREVTCSPFADSLRGDPQPFRSLSIRASRLASEHDPRSHRQRSPAATIPHPPLELLLLGARERQGPESAARPHHANEHAKSVPVHAGRAARMQAAEIAGLRDGAYLPPATEPVAGH